jgi:hypothetical protein
VSNLDQRVSEYQKPTLNAIELSYTSIKVKVDHSVLLSYIAVPRPSDFAKLGLALGIGGDGGFSHLERVNEEGTAWHSLVQIARQSNACQ